MVFDSVMTAVNDKSGDHECGIKLGNINYTVNEEMRLYKNNLQEIKNSIIKLVENMRYVGSID